LDLEVSKRDVVVTTDEQYPQHISVQFVQDKCDLLNSFQVGEAVKIDINLRGRVDKRSGRNRLFQYYSRLENCKITS
jgi:hypothetical protein